jgi:uncharacterized protein (TIGR00730 family)
MVKSVWLCGAASNNVFPEALKLAAEVGEMLAKNNIKMVFGGGNTGVMGAAADSVVKHGGKLLGVTIKHLQEVESILQEGAVIHEDYHDVVVEQMSVRKEIQLLMSDAFLILPGGVGTIDELMDVLTLRVIQQTTKPIIVVDPTDDNRFSSIIKNMLSALPALGVIPYDPNILITYVKSAEEVLEIIKGV